MYYTIVRYRVTVNGFFLVGVHQALLSATPTLLRPRQTQTDFRLTVAYLLRTFT